jgi:hypothetical protein
MGNKRYILCCAVCGLVFEATRRDALWCSSSCRVWLKRHPVHLNELRATCKAAYIAPFHLLLAKAVLVLRADLEARINAGASLFELQPEMRRSTLLCGHFANKRAS